MNFDELLNEYIDNSLSKEQLEDLNKRLKEDESLYKKLKALQIVDNILKQMEIYQAPNDIAAKIMNIILERTQSIKKSVHRFTLSVFSFLFLILLSVSGAMVLVINKANSTKSTDFLKKYISYAIGLLSNIMENNILLLITSAIVLIGFTGIYFILEAHNNFKSKLKDVS